MTIYDTIIIGAGPAGVTAAIYAARREMKTLIIGKELGGQIALTSDIENYPGFPSINNYDLIMRMQEHVKSVGVEIKNSEVTEIEKEEDIFCLETSKEKFQAKTIIIAMGLEPRRAGIYGELKFTGRGVSYCSNCDGPFYKGKTVAVLGGGNSALDAAEVLSKIASKVYLIHRRDKFRGFDSLVKKVQNIENIQIILNSQIKKILGEEKLEKIQYENTDGMQELNIDGLFIEIGRVASTDIVAHLVERDDNEQIITDQKFRTKTDGVLACGDVVSSDFKQITIACGQATIAALSAYKYLQNLPS